MTEIMADPGDRMMVDLDLLVPPEDGESLFQELLSIGYCYVDPDHVSGGHHFTPLGRADCVAAIEVHTGLTAQGEPQWTTFEDLLRKSSPITVNDYGFRVLDPSHAVFYTLFHSEIHHEFYARGNLSIRSMSDFAELDFHHSNRVDWGEIRDISRKCGVEHVVRDYLFAANRLFGTEIPRGLLPTLRTRLHFYRCLTKPLRLPHYLRVKQSVARYRLGRALLSIGEAFSSAHLCRMYTCSPSFRKLLGVRLKHVKHLIATYVFGRKKQRLSAALFDSHPDHRS